MPDTAPDKVVSDEIKLQIAGATSPEAEVVYKVPSRANQHDIGTITEGFEIRKGPADLTSYHDFYKLQIAFEHIWTELFDKRLALQAQTLYEQYVKLKDFSATPDGSSFSSSGSATPPLSPPLPKPVQVGEWSVGRDQVNTNVNIQKGDIVQIVASGLIDFGGFGLGVGTFDPEGKPEPADSGGNWPAPGLKKYSLVYRIGMSDWVQGGGVVSFTAPAGGPLMFIANDDDRSDNALAWTVNVSVASGATADQGSGGSSSAGSDPTLSTVDELRRFRDEFRNSLSTSWDISNGSSSKGTDNKIPMPGAGPQDELEKLLSDLDKLMAEKYSFDVFAPQSVNFGLLVNYRQEWVPLNYQVGNLVSTIPLAPQEVRRYTTKTIVKKTRNVKAIDDSLHTRKEESTQTSRADSEIVQKALTKTNFQISADESFGSDETYKINAKQSVDQDQSKESKETKREFHETVLKAAQEYRDQHRMEVTTDESTETETTTFQEIRNPNDELTVTYLFYELQRTYNVSERLHKLIPVILVANDVPAPHEIAESWLITHDWILKRAILDDSFLPALQYLSTSFVGAEVALQVQAINVQKQHELVTHIGQQVRAQNSALQAAQANLDAAVAKKASDEGIVSTGSFVKSFFDPLGLTQSGKTDDTADKTMIDAAKDALDRAQNAARQLMSQLETEMTALQAATNKYAAAVQEHFNQLAAIDRLRIHVKDNILYYMQAIWTYEPPDQRYFRLYNIDVPIFEHHTVMRLAPESGRLSGLQQQSGGRTTFIGTLAPPALDYELRKINEVADLDNLLGFKGNYMIFPLKQYNYLTYFMMQDYVDVDQIVRAKDPDEFGGFTLDDLEVYMQGLYAKDPRQFNAKREEFKALIVEYLSTHPNGGSDKVIVPTTSLYIEALPGTHPLLEDFKLIHRAIDVKKAQAEVRHAELENARLASRVLKGNDADPDVDKKIVVEGAANVTVNP